MTDVHRRLLLTERDDLLPLLRATPEADFDLPTVCTEWSVRDVIAHCASALIRVATGTRHGFSPAENQADVDERRTWPVRDVLSELEHAYELGAAADSVAFVALGEWIHGGDVREALGAPDAYASAGVEDALAILLTGEEGSVPPTDVTLSDAGLRGRIPTTLRLGNPNAEAVGRLHTDTAGLFRIIAGRRVEQVDHTVEGITLEDLRMFS